MKKMLVSILAVFVIILCGFGGMVSLFSTSLVLAENTVYVDVSGDGETDRVQDTFFSDILDSYPTMDGSLVVEKLLESSEKPTPVPTPAEFCWFDVDGVDWTTPAKYQGACGSCWDFAALGVLESMIKIRENCAELNPDLSEQYVLSCLPNAGSCHGGSAVEAFELIMATTPQGNFVNGVIPEACMGYEADDDVPCDAKCPEWEELLVPLLDFGYFYVDGSRSDREVIKTQIMETGPVVTHLRATDLFKIWGALNHNPTAYYPRFKRVFGINHVVMIVGWKDNPLMPAGGYWICKNSWDDNWGYNGFFNIAYGALNIDGFLIVWGDYDPESIDWLPYVDTGGPYGGFLNEELVFDGSGSFGFEGDIVDYVWNFGDNTTGSGEVVTHIYTELGIYNVTLTVTDDKGNWNTVGTVVWIQNGNEPPDKPSIQGPTSGETWTRYDYVFSTSDPEENDVYYYIDWGDETVEEWIGPYNSGEEIVVDHSWQTRGSRSIQAKVKDVYGAESDWETLEVSMPISQETTLGFLFLEFFRQLTGWFPHSFPLLKTIFGFSL